MGYRWISPNLLMKLRTSFDIYSPGKGPALGPAEGIFEEGNPKPGAKMHSKRRQRSREQAVTRADTSLWRRDRNLPTDETTTAVAAGTGAQDARAPGNYRDTEEQGRAAAHWDNYTEFCLLHNRHWSAPFEVRLFRLVDHQLSRVLHYWLWAGIWSRWSWPRTQSKQSQRFLSVLLEFYHG